jgi:hypothetical protein
VKLVVDDTRWSFRARPPRRGRRWTPLTSPGKSAVVRYLLIVFAILSYPHAAFAAPEEERARLQFQVAPRLASSCPDEESFRLKVAARLGYQPFTGGGPHEVTVDIRSTPTGIVARATVRHGGQSAPGVRTLDGKTEQCEAVIAALATAVALAVDPVRANTEVAAVPPTAPAPWQPTPPPMAPTLPMPPILPNRPAPPPQTEPVRPSAPVLFFGTANGLVSVGVLPGTAFGGELGVGGRFRSASLELGGRAEVMPSAIRLASGDAVEATIFSGVLSPCALLYQANLCGLVRLGALQGRAPEVQNPSLGTSLYAAAGARVGYSLELSRVVGLRALVSLEIPLVRTTLVVNRVRAWTAPPVTFGAQLGVVITIPRRD